MYTPERFLEYAKDKFKLDINPRSIEETNQIADNESLNDEQIYNDKQSEDMRKLLEQRIIDDYYSKLVSEERKINIAKLAIDTTRLDLDNAAVKQAIEDIKKLLEQPIPDTIMLDTTILDEKARKISEKFQQSLKVGQKISKDFQQSQKNLSEKMQKINLYLPNSGTRKKKKSEQNEESETQD
ncbi:MAG: hypothetical protein AB4080_23310 [Trichodesmium sp.]